MDEALSLLDNIKAAQFEIALNRKNIILLSATIVAELAHANSLEIICYISA